MFSLYRKFRHLLPCHVRSPHYLKLHPRSGRSAIKLVFGISYSAQDGLVRVRQKGVFTLRLAPPYGLLSLPSRCLRSTQRVFTQLAIRTALKPTTTCSSTTPELAQLDQSVQLERWSGQIGSPKWWLAEVLEQFPLLHIPTPLLTPTTLLGLADQLDRARLEKMYEGAEERLKQTTHIACEPRLEAPRCMSP